MNIIQTHAVVDFTMYNDQRSNDLFDESLRKLAELKAAVVEARRSYEEELSFVTKLAERADMTIPDDLILDYQPIPMMNQVSLFPAQNKQLSAPALIKPGEFFNKSLAESARLFLDKKEGNIAPFQEIIEALQKGGFPNAKAESDIKAIRLNLLKSSNFVLIPEDNFGLTSIYGGKRRAGRKKKTKE